jgi:hypothetical protein
VRQGLGEVKTCRPPRCWAVERHDGAATGLPLLENGWKLSNHSLTRSVIEWFAAKLSQGARPMTVPAEWLIHSVFLGSIAASLGLIAGLF